MSIEFNCSGCGNALRVQDEHAGREARCPACGQLTRIPSPLEVAGEAPPSADAQQPDVTQPLSPPATQVGGTPSGTPVAMRPHRGVLILILGICSLSCCGLLGIAPWMMANEDLSLMARGLMDPAGRGMTIAGRILGIIGLASILFWAVVAALNG